MRIRKAVAVAAAVAASLVAPAAASAHGSSSYVATVRGVTPPLAGLRVRMRRDGGIVVTNRSRLTLVVVGADGEQYLRLGRAGVDANFGRGARPRWVRVARGRTFSWPDSRTTVELGAPPLVVRKEPGKSHHVGDWRIPLRAGGRSYAIVGSLDYRVAGTGLAELLFPFAPTPLLLLLAVGVVRRVRR